MWKQVCRLCRQQAPATDGDVRDMLQQDLTFKFRLMRAVGSMWRTRDSSVNHRNGHARGRHQDADEHTEYWL